MKASPIFCSSVCVQTKEQRMEEAWEQDYTNLERFCYNAIIVSGKGFFGLENKACRGAMLPDLLCLLAWHYNQQKHIHIQWHISMIKPLQHHKDIIPLQSYKWLFCMASEYTYSPSSLACTNTTYQNGLNYNSMCTTVMRFIATYTSMCAHCNEIHSYLYPTIIYTV